FSGIASATFPLPGDGRLPVDIAISSDAYPMLKDDVATWVASDAQNFGWILKAENEVVAPTGRHLATPSIAVEYVPPSRCAGVACGAANECQTSTCDPSTGLCVASNKPDATACNADNNSCTKDVCT